MTTTVFIAGSRKITRLPAEIEARLDSIVEKGFAVVIGDADGADTAAQAYLSTTHYPNVTIFCVAHNCRNNVGKWPTRQIAATSGAKGFEFYATKDRAMAEVESRNGDSHFPVATQRIRQLHLLWRSALRFHPQQDVGVAGDVITLHSGLDDDIDALAHRLTRLRGSILIVFQIDDALTGRSK